MAGPNERRIVLLGKTGDGKSSTGNTILEEQVFPVSCGPKSITQKFDTKEKITCGKKIKVTDTPGIFNSEVTEETVNSEVIRCIAECSPGPHAFVIVLRVGKYTSHEKMIIRRFTDAFGQNSFKHALVLFTYGNDLDDGQRIEAFVEEGEELKELVQKCGGRCHVIDNKYWNQEHEYRSNRVQVEKLFNTIEEIVRTNEGCYSNVIWQRVEEKIQAEERRLSDYRGRNSSSDIRQQATKGILGTFLKELSSISIGALLGCLFGVRNIKGLLDGNNWSMDMIAVAVLTVVGGVIGHESAVDVQSASEGVRRTVQSVTQIKAEIQKFF